MLQNFEIVNLYFLILIALELIVQVIPLFETIGSWKTKYQVWFYLITVLFTSSFAIDKNKATSRLFFITQHSNRWHLIS